MPRSTKTETHTPQGKEANFMYNRKLGVLGGALLIVLSMVVIGCKQSVDSGNPNWTTDEKTKKVWEQDNSSDKYVRSFKQFGTSFSVTGTSSPIVAKLEVADLTTSKAGLVFGFNKYTENNLSIFCPRSWW